MKQQAGFSSMRSCKSSLSTKCAIVLNRFKSSAVYRRRSAPMMAAGSSEQGMQMTPEEEEIYNQILQSKKNKRKEEIVEYKRRSKFDPLAKKQALEQLQQQQQQQQQQGRLSGETIASSSSLESKEAKKPLSSAVIPIIKKAPVPSGLESTEELVQNEIAEEEEEDMDDEGFEAAALKFLQEEEQEALKTRAATTTNPSQQSPSVSPSSPRTPSQAPPRRTVVAPGSYKPGAGGGLSLGPSTIRSSSGSKQAAGKGLAPNATPEQAKTAASDKRISKPMQQQKQQRRIRPSQSGSKSSAGAAAEFGLSDEDLAALLEETADDAPEDEAEQLDWDTLAAGESFEKYLSELQNEAEGARIRRERAVARQQAAAIMPAKEAPVDEESEVAAEDAELEQLLKLLEMVDETSPGAQEDGASPGQGSLAGKEKSRAKREEMEDDIDWSVLEKMFLGKDWDHEIQEMARQASQTVDRANSNADAESSTDSCAPWEDEVTTLLLGLVDMSHQRYLNKGMMDRIVPEEERAKTFWDADFALIFHDNSGQALLEYANKKALELTGHDFDDIYDLSSFDLVDQSDAQQQEWLWANSEAEDKIGKHTVVPLLRLKGAGGKVILVRDALVFRVDNFEGDLIGQATVMRQWEWEHDAVLQ